MRRTLPGPAPTILLVIFAMLVGACGSEGSSEDARPTVGFILVGPRDDLGYNQAIWTATEELAREYPEVRILRRENVPETDEARIAMEELIDEGATMLFATSFGHLDAARAVAEAHPDVDVAHQGGTEGEPDLANLGTYFGSHHEFLYAAGIAAAADSGDHRLGFVVAFPIPSVYASVNAFALGAQSVDPDATVLVRFTEAWCDGVAQERAVDELLEDDVSVIAFHQDCGRRILERAEAAGIGVVGYHADGSEVAPTSWIVGAVWDWRPVMSQILRSHVEGRFAQSDYAGDFRGTLRRGNSPAKLTEAGPRVAPDTVAAMEATLDDFSRGARTPFDGPLVDAAGVRRVGVGESLTMEEIDRLDYFVNGVET